MPLPPRTVPAPTHTAPAPGGARARRARIQRGGLCDVPGQQRVEREGEHAPGAIRFGDDDRQHQLPGGQTKLHPDFGGNGAYGIPFLVVPATQPKVPIHYTAYGDESDPGPFPIPGNAPVEGGSASTGDRHVLVVQQGTCHLYELGRAFWEGNHWNADVGVNWNLSSNSLRPRHWTSADVAGLPILPGLVRYDEVASGHIDHALRFTVPKTQKGFILPATHDASSSTNPALPPMGLRLRLKASFSLAGYHGESLVILQALKTYGMIVADNGSSWYISGAVDKRWNDDDLDQLKTVPGTAFEAVDTGPIQH